MAKNDPMPPRAEWTADDWRDLYRAIELAKRKIRKRHKEKPREIRDGNQGTN